MLFNLPWKLLDGVVAISSDSNWYIKRLNNIEIDKQTCVISVCRFPLLPLFQTHSYGPGDTSYFKPKQKLSDSNKKFPEN